MTSRMIKGFSLFLTLMLLISFFPTLSVQAANSLQPAALQTSVPRFEPGDCAAFSLPVGFGQGRKLECGWLVTPELHEKPTGKTIRLGVVILRSLAANPPTDPLFMMQGGPGGSTLHDFPSFLAMGKLLQSERDIVLFDQRGTLFAEPKLSCSETQDLAIRTLDQNLSDAENLRLSNEAVAACRQRLQKEGVNLAAYTSVENAGDVDALRQALGYDQINLYGVSYGTLLALDVMRLYPQGLRSVILDSVVQPNDHFVNGIVNTDVRTLNLIFAGCAAQADCNRAYPNLEKVFYEQVDRLNKTPVHITLTDSTNGGKTAPALLNGDTLMNVLFYTLYVTDFIPVIPQVIYDVRAGDYSFIERIYSQVVYDFSISDGMYYSVNCADYQNEPAPAAGDFQLPPEMEKLRALSVQNFYDSCKTWSVPLQDPQADQPVKSDIPTLVMSGAFDPATPPANADEVMKTLGRAFRVNFPAGAHGEALGNACGERILQEFVQDPSRQPDTACISPQSPQFITKSSIVRLPKLISLLNLEGTSVPEGLLLLVGLLFLLTCLLAYPLAWVIRMIRGRKPAQSPYPVYDPANPASSQAAAAGTRQPSRPAVWRFAPWLAILAAGGLAVFMGILLVILFGMIANNDNLLLFGLPGSSRPLFILPILVLLTLLAMLLVTFMAWVRRWGSVWGRLYFTLLTLAGLACVFVLALWGMLTALVA